MVEDEVLVKTTSGDVQGHRSGTVSRFFGIPYGAPTGGTARYKPARPPEPWTGVLDAVVNGPSCPQPEFPPRWQEEIRPWLGEHEIVPLPGKGKEGPSESCLVLNVFTPGADDAGRPVMVWLHGGFWSMGAGTSPFFDGRPLATRGDVVVVAINHRLGAFGFCNVADMAGEAFQKSGNVGVLDIVLALEWVRDNIARFGGDPDNVTLFGESGGGRKGTFMLAMPAARGLFHRVIIQSGAQLRAHTSEANAQAAAELMRTLGLGEHDVEALQRVPPDKIISVIGQARAFEPMVDGELVPRHPVDAIANGLGSDVPVIVGTTRDEEAISLIIEPRLRNDLNESNLRAELAAKIGEGDTDRVLPAYQASRPGAPALEIFIAALTDQERRIPSIRLAETIATRGRSSVYMYVFSYPDPSEGYAIHSGDLPFTFDVLDPGRKDLAAAQAVADQFSGAWLAFAKNGDPNHQGMPRWDAYDLDRRATMVFGTDTACLDDPWGSERRAWDEVVVTGA